MQDQTTNFDESPLRRLLNTTWPLATLFRVEIRISWTVAIWPLFFTYGFTTWMDSFSEALVWGIAWTLALFTTVWTHEMGHIAMGRKLGIESQRMTLRGLGGLAHLDSPAQTPRDDILISLAGPAVHLVWMAALYPLVWLLGETHEFATWFWMLEGFAYLQVSMLIFNLLPFYPLDGGRTFRSAMALRMHANKASLIAAKVGFVGHGLFIVTGVLAWLELWDPLHHGPYGFMLVWLGIWGIQMCRQLLFQARHGEIFGAHDPFQKTLMESRRVMDAYDREEAKEREQRRKQSEQRQALQQTVDALLDRITEVGGVEQLSSRERKELERASKQLSDLE